MKTAREYFEDRYGAKSGEYFGVNYREYEYSRVIETISIDKAVEILEDYIDEVDAFLNDMGLEHTAEQVRTGAYNGWGMKHFVVF